MRPRQPFPLCLIGKRVEIEWRDDDADWRNYKILAASDGWILLAGMPQGEAQNDTRFWAPLADVATIMELA